MGYDNNEDRLKKLKKTQSAGHLWMTPLTPHTMYLGLQRLLQHPLKKGVVEPQVPVPQGGRVRRYRCESQPLVDPRLEGVLRVKV